jgi:adenosylmethionine-8-amino-7-oxononanoate aminotransferase
MAQKLFLLPGDGIGTEIMAEVAKIIAYLNTQGETDFELDSGLAGGDIRNIGLVGAIELQPIPGEPTKRAFSAFLKAFEKGLLIRTTGDIIALSPPLIVEKHHIDTIVETLGGILKTLE